jgi:hypothetical protein
LSIFGCVFKISSIKLFVLKATVIFAYFRNLVINVFTLLCEHVNKALLFLGLAVLFMLPSAAGFLYMPYSEVKFVLLIVISKKFMQLFCSFSKLNVKIW